MERKAELTKSFSDLTKRIDRAIRTGRNNWGEYIRTVVEIGETTKTDLLPLRTAFGSVLEYPETPNMTEAVEESLHITREFVQGKPSIDLNPLIVSHWQAENPPSEKRKKNLKLVPATTELDRRDNHGGWGWARFKHGKEYSDVYLDAPYAIVLTYKGTPNAIAAFRVEEPGTWLVTQLQGLRPKRYEDKGPGRHARGLVGLDFKALLRDGLRKVAKKLGAKTIGIQEGGKSIWVDSHIPGFEITGEQARQKYDEVAEDWKFEQRDNGNWYKELSD